MSSYMDEASEDIIFKLEDGTELRSSNVKMYKEYMFGDNVMRLQLSSPGWKDVRKSLPEEYERVLAVISVAETTYEVIAYLENGKWISFESGEKIVWGEGILEHVVAWMEIPDYPDWILDLVEKEGDEYYNVERRE